MLVLCNWHGGKIHVICTKANAEYAIYYRPTYDKDGLSKKLADYKFEAECKIINKYD